ncbi:MAG: TetR/AcrR family transcriptional regulator [Clostridiales bacterium]|nr:TetR/AcrR family transcriptional regulator [Clostridiales bacterium]
MNTKNNQRFQESERKIQKALMDLVKTGDIQCITVQNICNEAEVNRTTFYAHFSDIRELTEQCEMQIRETITRTFQLSGSGQDSDRQWQLFVLRSMKDYMNFYRLYFQYHKTEPAQNGPATVWLSNDEKIEHSMSHYYRVFYRAGAEAILMRWINKNCTETPEELQFILSQCLSKNSL